MGKGAGKCRLKRLIQTYSFYLGNPVLNFEDLRKGSKYEDGYTAESTSIVHLWQVGHSLLLKGGTSLTTW